ncbi:hypothetical protein K505DRAFT_263875 [Melanomma pulvis-pyrius CBS 109.77]|uniref:Uncharacterized protein n=1 Tax=Melanomma pulvis-pyrius CBS 109.77 TaxID=1314802 RepID=A0A6A6XUX8_9PLEO|nr:hypothetical protein K505DRAFT_263875 [Melanomma pulvis-pyrius CBS 109.77]
MSALTTALSSMFSATNENYAALANVKFDFSLIKMEAPVEFNGIVSALSARRRIEAEEGPPHKIARRLGALFEDLVPSTPKLIKAYGLRMSEIMNTSDVNDIGTGQHGPFEPYVGADGTTLWAAATSGISALGIYLLSCLLARAWDAKIATAIWVELVATRRKEIEEGLKNNHNISASSVVGAYQDITRKDLALWDSSARAWLRRADKAKEWSQCQLSLVVKNINTPIPGGPSTYDKVISVWKRSMLAVEQFLSGKPQDIVDGSVFLAFSAWHLYPDLIVLGAEPTKVEFKDKLIPSAGVGTVGVEFRALEKEGVQWSLALSHLQYYGDPVVVRSDQDNSRLTFAQLQIVALGGLLGGWRISSRDFLSVAEWFKLLWSRMGLSEEDIKNGDSSEFGWLLQFVAAANQLLAANDQDHQQNMILLKHGSRRAKDFLSDRSCNPSPFFGLLNALTICGLLEKFDVDSGIAYLRALAEKLELRGRDAIICYAHNASYKQTTGSVDYFELATVQTSNSKAYVRWICPNGEAKSFPSGIDVNSQGKLQDEESVPKDRMKYISSQGEKCEHYITGPNYASRTDNFSWITPPSIYLQDGSTTADDHDDAMHQPKKVKVNMSFQAIIGDWRLGLFLRSEMHKYHDSLQSYQERAEFEIAKTEKVSTAVQIFKDTEPVPERLRDYMCSLIYVSEDQLKDNSLKAPGVSLISSAHRFHLDFSKSLYALDSASKVYSHVVKATISLKLIARPLCNSAWFRCLFKRWEPGYSNGNPWSTQTPLLTPQHSPLPDRHESFGCIALFDSGTVDLSPEDFEHSFALCSEDTIYVPAVVLSDPFTRVPEYAMKSITGNISRPGISILVPPFKPRIRELSDSYNLVIHEAYDFKREDNFRETSLHLSFTDWALPLATEGSRMIDHDAQVVEAVISIRDRGRWVADIDILEVDFQDMIRFKPVTCCKGDHDQNHDFDYTSIDSWEELLDEPSTVGIFRAHGNWAARLAAVSILSRSEAGGHNFGVLGPEPFCLQCLEEEFEKPGWNMLDYESTLPSFCID